MSVAAIRCVVPYRIDVSAAPDDGFDRLVELGALDVEAQGGGLAAILPDSLDPTSIATALGVSTWVISPAVERDEGSTWILSPRPVRAAGLWIHPSTAPPAPGTLRLHDGSTFGTGMHPTTGICLDAIEAAIATIAPARLLDVGTGSGILALAGLCRGVPEAVGLDCDPDALGWAAENARLNGLRDRFRLVLGGPESLTGTWPLVVANLLAAPLIDMAPVLVQRVAHRGRLVVSGIPTGVAADVAQVYRRLGMRPIETPSRAGWSAVVLDASW